MFLKATSGLRCPECREPIKVKEIIRLRKAVLVHGSLSCRCRSYPVFDSVCFVARNQTTDWVRSFLKENKDWLAKNEDLPIFLLRHPYLVSPSVFKLITRINFFGRLSFRQFVKLFVFFGLYEKAWGRYILNRTSDPSFRFAISATSFVRRSATVLDAGCGSGQFLGVLGKLVPPKNLYAAEQSLPGLYLAKKYFSPKANYFYLSLEEKLPFRNGYFDNLFANAVLHYVKRQKLLIDELKRVGRKKTVLVLTNIYNKSFKRSFVDKNNHPKTAREYAQLFGSPKRIGFYKETVGSKRLELIEGADPIKKASELRTFTIVYRHS